MTRSAVRAIFILGALACTLVPSPTHAYQQRPGLTERVSVTNDGSHADGTAKNPVVSADGRFVAFESRADNLAPGLDTHDEDQIYVHDRDTGVTEIVSVSTEGLAANDWGNSPDISADGRYVVFDSLSDNLVPGKPRQQQVYLHDRLTATTELVSRTSDGAHANRVSWNASISGDGRYIAYQSYSSNLVPGTTPERIHIFVLDRATNEVELISRAPNGEEANNFSAEPAISADGRFVSYNSLATNLVDTPVGPLYDIFVLDRSTGETQLASVRNDGTAQDTSAFGSAISGDGRYITFHSNARNLAPANSYDTYHVYVRDRVAATTERVSVSSEGVEGSGLSMDPAISDDGRYITYMSFSFNLTPEEELNERPDVYVYDRETKATEKITIAADGGAADSDSFLPDISGDGRVVVFETITDNLIPNDTNNRREAFARERGPATGIGDVSLVDGDDAPTGQGWATFSGMTVSAGDAPSSPTDAGLGAADMGITRGSVIYRTEREDLLFRSELQGLSSDVVLLDNQGRSVTARPPTIVYGWGFDAAGSSWEVRAQRFAPTAASSTIPFDHAAKLFRCTPDCVFVTDLRGGVGTAGNEVRAGLPLETIGIEPGATLTNVSAFAAPGEVTAGYAARVAQVDLPDGTLPIAAVTLGLGSADSTPAEVAFDIDVVVEDGRFTAELDPARFGVARVLWAKACLAASCGTASVALPGPDPSPSSSLSPTVEPSEDPLPLVTDVAFTDASARAGQYSDEVRFEAVLTDEGGSPLADEELTFELTGGDGSRSFTANTGTDGIAVVTPRLGETPGAHQLTVRFAGTEGLAAAADSASFVVDKEDSALELVVTGRGSNRVLDTTLTDRDDAAAGLKNRTIDFYADGELIGSVTTNEDGAASLDAPPRYRGGKHEFEARFDGDDFFLAATDREQT